MKIDGKWTVVGINNDQVGCYEDHYFGLATNYAFYSPTK